ncbi:MAG: DUF2914 domain-containing protein [Patescibacteria group bacterium]|nr:DUF2914 domain-containing protein [bacterium]MDZ4240578.1 DUF2914 domain-containing protein [Patescibacteria group bacterium]
MITNPFALVPAPVREFVKKHERHVGTISIFTGFIWDSFTLVRPDQLYTNIVLLWYILVSACGILLLTIYGKKGDFTPTILLAIVQFAFGNLAGGFIVLYARSGTLVGSFLFFLIFGAFLVGNEFLRTHYARLNFHISAWYFLFVSYCALIFPIIVRQIGDGIFFASTIISLLIVFVFLSLLYMTSPERVTGALKSSIFSIGTIFILFNSFYFLNIIPPVPLSIREIGVYHSVARLPNGNYQVVYEKPSWYEFLRSTDDIFTYVEGDSAYCFSSVFAPVRISTNIYHRWEHFNEKTGNWETVARIPFPIAGGRLEGYRGYTQKTNLLFGRYRCSVETHRGTLIGRTTFTVVEGEGIPFLSEKEI